MSRPGRASAFSLIELLTVLAIVVLLVSLLIPIVGHAHASAISAECAANLRTVGHLLISYGGAHGETLPMAVRQRDYFWDRGEQTGWDIRTGRWAGVRGGLGSIWLCREQNTAYVGNARALGLDSRSRFQYDSPNLIYPVTFRHWHETARLVLCYDLQSDLIDSEAFAHARDPAAGDLSDEAWGPWPRNDATAALAFQRDRGGPHRDSYGVLFADGHARVALFPRGSTAVYWSGPRWWIGKYDLSFLSNPDGGPHNP